MCVAFRWPVAGGRWPVAGGRWPVAGGARHGATVKPRLFMHGAAMPAGVSGLKACTVPVITSLDLSGFILTSSGRLMV